MAALNSALTLTLPGAAFPWAQLGPQHLLSAAGKRGRRQGLPGSVTARFGPSCRPSLACGKPRLAARSAAASARLSLPARARGCAVAPRWLWGRGEPSQPLTETVVKSPRHFNCQSGLMGYKNSPAPRL